MSRLLLLSDYLFVQFVGMINCENSLNSIRVKVIMDHCD